MALHPRLTVGVACTLFLSLLMVCARASAAPPDPATPPTECVGLVLGGGGARGAAHIGVLHVMERERIPVCQIAGTSMGAIVGGLYASGYTTDELQTLIETLDWADLFIDDAPRLDQPMRRKDADFRYLLNLELGFSHGKVVMPGGLVQGQKLLLLLRRLTLSTWDVETFDALPIRFRAVAADIGTGQRVVFERGDLALAIRSSMSVPGAFAPLRVDGRLLVDGGMVDNVPIDVVRDMGAGRLVVVDVGSPLHDEAALTNPLAIMDQMIGALMIEKTQRQLATLAPDDVLIRPELGDLTASEFNRGSEAIAAGVAAAEAAVPALRRYAVDEARYAAYRDAQRKRAFDPGLVNFLEIAPGRSAASSARIERALRGDVGRPLDVERLEQQLGVAYSASRFQQLDYRLIERNGVRGLAIEPTDRPWSVFGKFGFQLSDDFAGRNSYMISSELTVADVNRWGAEWLTMLRAGRISGVRTEFHQPMGGAGLFYVQPSLLAESETLPLWLQDQQIAEYRVKRREVAVAFGYTPTNTFRVSADLARGRDRSEELVGNPLDFDRDRQDFAVIRLNATWDSLDSIDFPTRGWRLSADYEMYRDMLGSNVEGDVARITGDWAHAWGRYHLLVGAHASSAVDDDHFFRAQDFLGGFLNLSGYDERALFGNQTALLRTVVYRRTGDTSRLFSLPLYVGASLETGNAWLSRDSVDGGELIVAGSIFAGVDTPLGPMFLAYGYNDDGHGAWYLTFGSLLRPVVR
ncbi:patatin-like phospholipase family protein [Pseudoxanthomonas sp. Root630]|uniref:patatin-like phospholipase family protein n=1 Tax=Pseudoxanthomonas sp. Root630 TaxID=1736574 RepID=UPI0009D76732|nr:patatin-like phospholipase family protein [Pseudoxanthomonas sp. Root630]